MGAPLKGHPNQLLGWMTKQSWTVTIGRSRFINSLTIKFKWVLSNEWIILGTIANFDLFLLIVLGIEGDLSTTLLLLRSILNLIVSST